MVEVQPSRCRSFCAGKPRNDWRGTNSNLPNTCQRAGLLSKTVPALTENSLLKFRCVEHEAEGTGPQFENCRTSKSERTWGQRLALRRLSSATT
jgi:hypothetical protein